MNFLDTLERVLKQDARFVADDGSVLKTAVYNASMAFDEKLLQILLDNKETKSHFFKAVNGTFVFDKIRFAWVLESREFLPDSYTMYKNKIGLTNNKGKLISQSDDVTLVWPYKDCVLEGGQTKDEQKRDEVFYNETLAPDEVNRLLYPKVFTNAKRYTKDGVEDITTFDENDNLIIKGNNLLALSSLLKRYENKIKLVYIDPPFNTGGDDNIFSYNNNFNHSTWLTFIKNRLVIAKRLITKDGFIAVSIDHAELFYLGALMDEIFGRENRISIITVQHNPKGRNQADFFSSNSEFMLVYALDRKTAKFNNVAIDENVIKTFTEKDENGLYRWEPYIRARTVWSRENRPQNWYLIYISPDLKDISSKNKPEYTPIFPKTAQGDFSWKNIEKTFKELNKSDYFKAKKIDGEIKLFHKYYEQQVFKNVWIDKKYQSEFHGTNLLKKLIGKTKFSYPKSLYTVSDIIKITTKKDDYVLDFFGGSGTTAHAVFDANKKQEMNRKFITVEQLDEHISVMIKRLSKVIELQGGGSFVYCELKELNESVIADIQLAETDEELNKIKKSLLDTGYISHKVDIKEISKDDTDYNTLSFENKKKFLLELIDKNKLYVNLCDIDDTDMNVSQADKDFTNSFYGRQGE